MSQSDSSPDRSSAVAFIAFAAAAAVWLGVMAVQPNGTDLQAATIVMTKDIAVTLPSPHWTEIAGLH
ncbi:MAG: hypothetical protein ABW213_01680 [Tardiphaga sp.]